MSTHERFDADSTEWTTGSMLDAMHQHVLDMYGEIRTICEDETEFVRLPESVRDAVSRMEEHIGHLDNLACVVKEDVAGELAQIEQLEREWIELQEYIRAGQVVISGMNLVSMVPVPSDRTVPEELVQADEFVQAEELVQE